MFIFHENFIKARSKKYTTYSSILIFENKVRKVVLLHTWGDFNPLYGLLFLFPGHEEGSKTKRFIFCSSTSI